MLEFKIFAGVIGGLALFIYGMNLMGKGLQKIAGKGLKRIIEALTRNKYLGVLLGALVTMIIQSSSATTVMVVGFVNASLMTLNQAIGVIMGANIGTTVTAQLVAFKLTTVAPLVVATGVVLHIVSKRRRYVDIAEVLIGFGILFIGMGTMSSVLGPLVATPFFKGLLLNLEDPIMGVVVGFVMTVSIQSSSATIGLLIAVASSGAIGLNIALPILFGDNIGTCVTALLSSIGANRTAKRAALAHLLFNVVGTIVFIFLIYASPLIFWIERLNIGHIERQIANAHTIFNIMNTLILLPFAGAFGYAVTKILPVKESERKFSPSRYLDSRIIEETPSIAVGLAIKEGLEMGKLVGSNVILAKEALFEKSMQKIQEVSRQEEIIDNVTHSLTQLLIELSNQELSGEQKAKVSGVLSALSRLERIGDLAEEISETAEYAIDNRVEFTPAAITELEIMFNAVSKGLDLALEALRTESQELVVESDRIEDEIDAMERTYRKKHIERLNARLCSTKSGIVFLDLIGYLERMSDHSRKMAALVGVGNR